MRTFSSQGPASAHTELVLGQTIGRYQVRRLLGRGGMGQVYLARDIALGRSIALKIVGAGVHAGRLLGEARAIAMLDHPNIVKLYHCEEYERGIYLALEYVDGDSLRDRIRGGRIDRDEALRYTLAIADALAHAHAVQVGEQRGVFHCDLKPGNVMVGRDGRVRVVDFGIARTADDALDSGGGTADWMAPEQWSSRPITDRVDVWALAIVCTQLLTGAHPLGDDPARRREAARDPRRMPELTLEHDHLPAPVVELITRSLVHDPAARPSAAEWVRLLDDVINGRGDAAGDAAPYPGLAPFDEHHARFYVGREREVDEFLERLRDTTYLPIVGPSGVGKSSFLHAGVIPRLRRREHWTVLAFRPGADPVGALARIVVAASAGDLGDRALRVEQTKAEIGGLRDALLEHPGLLSVRLATLAASRNNHVLLAVDQLEEVFSQCSSEHERGQFLTMLLGAADDPLDPVRVVFTVRDDFLGKIASLRTLLVMQKLGRADLRRTITEPLARHHYQFDDPAIVDELLAEVGSAVADLPLLQFACRTLWDGRDIATRQLRRATYAQMGGLAGALAQHAEAALAALGPVERRLTRQVLLQLVSGTTRRSVARDQLVASIGREADLIIDRLLVARLLVQRIEGDGEAAIVEIAHESLLQTWSQLARWVGESRDERRLLDELEDATSLWERRGKRAEETWSREDLAAARHRAARLELAIPARAQAFLAAGDLRHRAQRRKRRITYSVALALSGALAALAFTLTARYLAREQVIQANAGTVDFVFTPFDWVNDGPRPIEISELPDFTWELYSPLADDPHTPGARRPAKEVEVLRSSLSGGSRVDRVRAQGGMAFLKISGRGRGPAACAPSWIRIQAFPGYSGDKAPRRMEIEVPTCQASRANMLPVEAGPFVYGGPGERPSSFYGKADYTQDEREATLPAFWMDRTEVANAAFAPFAHMASITGYAAPIYGKDPMHLHDNDWDIPVTNIDAYRAAAYCRYLGKELPGDLEWVKAARGGTLVHGVPNPYPRRQFPWGLEPSPTCVNQQGTEDGAAWTAPVGSYACGAGPYGHLNLVGNVDEWIARDKQLDRDATPLHAMRGGSVISPPQLELTSISFRNHRDPNKVDYAIGLRCVAY